MTEPHGHKRAAVEGNEGIPNQILTANGNSFGGIDRCKEGIGGALSQLLVSLILKIRTCTGIMHVSPKTC